MPTDPPALDLDHVRSQFPGLDRGWTLFDNAGGSQILRGAVEAMTAYLFERNVQIGGTYDLSVASARSLREARAAAATWVNAARPEEVVFGPSTTALLQLLSRAMRSQLEAGDEVVVTEADHESNIGPWMALRDMGVEVRTWPLNRDTMRLETADLAPLLTDRTRLVAMTHVSNILGTVHPVAEVARMVHDAGARLCVDAVAYAPHRLIDVQAWGVDYYVFSLYKTYGPHYALMYGRHAHLLELDPQYHWFYGRDVVPGKLEPGNASYEDAATVPAILDYLAGLGEGDDARARLASGYAAITAQEDALTGRLMAWLTARNDCTVVGPVRAEGSDRIPTIAFRLHGRDSAAVARAVDAHHVAIRHGDFHSKRLVDALGEGGDGGLLRVSMVHYNTLDEVDRLCAALETTLRAAA